MMRHPRASDEVSFCFIQVRRTYIKQTETGHLTASHNTLCINALQDMRATKREHAYLVKHCISIFYKLPTKLLREEVGTVGDDAVELTLRDESGIVQSPDTGTVAHVMEP